MGRATIISDLGSGQYTIKPVYNDTYIDAAIAQLTTDIATFTAEISALESDRDAIVANYDTKQAELNAAIAAYRIAYDADPATASIADVLSITAEINQLVSDLSRKNNDLGHANIKKLSATKRKTKLESIKSGVTNRSAWNVALIEGLSGEVDTLEKNGEPDTILIGSAGFDSSKLTEIYGQSVAGSLFNFSLTPYWQKWNPTIRFGTITSLNGNLADVSLDSATSHYQGLDINQTGTLSNVPIVYMTCNEAAFEVGDKVVVAFLSQNWSNPRIIGFQTNPAACPGTGDIDTYFSAVQFYTRWPAYWTATDIGGNSPDVAMENYSVVGYWNKVLDYIKDECLLTATVDTLPTPVSISIDFDYSGGFALRTKCNGVTPDSPPKWVITFGDIDGLSPALSLSGAGLGTQINPNKYYYNLDNWVDIDNYVDGEIYISFSFQGNVSGVTWALTYYYKANIKSLLGV